MYIKICHKSVFILKWNKPLNLCVMTLTIFFKHIKKIIIDCQIYFQASWTLMRHLKFCVYSNKLNQFKKEIWKNSLDVIRGFIIK